MRDGSDFASQLDRCLDYESIFKLVKIAVKRNLGRERAGLILGLQDLPQQIGAFHQMGSNFIIMNRALLDLVDATGDRELTNAYVFHLLLHEYIHSLGFVNEQETQIVTHMISQEFLGKDHAATQLARLGIGVLLSRLRQYGFEASEESGQPRRGIKIVKDIDSENLDYFG